MTVRLVLVGPMGAGKTTVADLLAEAWGVPARDTDADVEALEGRTISDIFVESGEQHFRELERKAVADALATHDGVLALGGGAVLDPATRELLAGLPVVFLRVGLSDAVKRVGLGTSRPLLLGNVRARIKSLLDERTPVYESVASHVVDTDDRTPDEVAAEILELPAVTTIRVAGPAPYDVEVGHGVLDRLPALLGPDVRRVALVHPPGLVVDVPGYELLDLEVPDGESAKTASVVAACWERLGQAGFTRSDAVVTLGGGATTDVGGFVAATWLRGVRVVHLPTSLLGMVDAAIGGKTGIDTGAGKNLVGSFHEPAGVLCDLDFLASLPPAELVSGLGEVVKCGFIADPEILTLVEKDPAAVLDPASEVLAELVERSVRVKAAVVAADLRETGGSDDDPGREVLNYGHTLAHAIERVTGYAVRHGEAVSIGMVYVAELARLAGRLDEETAFRHASVLTSVGLPTSWSGAPFAELLEVMRVDKKARGATLRFVVLDGLARPAVLSGPSDELLGAAYEAIA